MSPWLEYPVYVALGPSLVFSTRWPGWFPYLHAGTYFHGTAGTGGQRHQQVVATLAQNIFAVGGFHSKGINSRSPMLITSPRCPLGAHWRLAGHRHFDALFKRILALVMVAVVASIVFNRQSSIKGTGKKLSGRYGAPSLFCWGYTVGSCRPALAFWSLPY